MSNTLRNMPGLVSASASKTMAGKKPGLLDFPPLKRSLLSLYDSIFRWYYDRQ